MAQRTTDLQAEAQWEEATLTRDASTRDVMTSDVMTNDSAAPSYRATDAEITLAKNEIPDDRMVPRASWHVHLELRSEEFDKLQRVGLANHALAWREGMDSWQPVDDGAQLRRLTDTLPPSAGVRVSASGRTSGSQDPLRTGSFFDFVQRYSRPGQGDVKPVIETRAFQVPPPPPPPRAQRTTDLPPPGPLPTRDASLARHVPYAIVQQHHRLPSSLPPAMAIEAIRQNPRVPPGFRRWAPMFTIVPVSAAVGALVASLVLTFRAPGQPVASSMLPSRPAAAPVAAAYAPMESGDRPTTVSASSLPTAGAQTPEAPRVSLDALPKVGSGGRSIVAAGSVAAAPVAMKASALPPKEAAEKPPERETRAQRRVRLRRALEERLAASAAAQQERAQEKAAEKAEQAPPPEPTPVGPPDRAAIGRAVATAGNAATGCGSGPESGRAAVTFAPSGNVQSVRLIEPFSDSSVNGCVLRALGRARVPAFTGDAVEVHKSLKW
jgi:hypothetical protein